MKLPFASRGTLSGSGIVPTVRAALLAALVTSVLYAVWYFHRNIPGLRLWVLSFLGATVFSTTLLLRTFMPEVVSVLLAQGVPQGPDGQLLVEGPEHDEDDGGDAGGGGR